MTTLRRYRSIAGRPVSRPREDYADKSYLRERHSGLWPFLAAIALYVAFAVIVLHMEAH